MNGLKLVIGSKNASSWSLAALAAAQAAGPAVRGDRDPAAPAGHGRCGSAATRPAARCRCCSWAVCGSGTSLAIAEYLAEQRPGLVARRPRGPGAGARRSAREMHSGFAALRTFLPMDFTARFGPPGKLLAPVAARHRADRRDLGRVPASSRPGRAVPVRRVHHRGRDVRAGLLALHDLRRAAATPAAQAYVEHMMALPAMLEWGRGCRGRAGARGDRAASAVAGRAGAAPSADAGGFAPGRWPWRPPPSRRDAGPPEPTSRTRARRQPEPMPEPDPAGTGPSGATRHGGAATDPSRTAAERAAGRAAPRAAADPVDDHGQAHRGRNSATTLR